MQKPRFTAACAAMLFALRYSRRHRRRRRQRLRRRRCRSSVRCARALTSVCQKRADSKRTFVRRRSFDRVLRAASFIGDGDDDARIVCFAAAAVAATAPSTNAFASAASLARPPARSLARSLA